MSSAHGSAGTTSASSPPSQAALLPPTCARSGIERASLRPSFSRPLRPRLPVGRVNKDDGGRAASRAGGAVVPDSDFAPLEGPPVPPATCTPDCESLRHTVSSSAASLTPIGLLGRGHPSVPVAGETRPPNDGDSESAREPPVVHAEDAARKGAESRDHQGEAVATPPIQRASPSGRAMPSRSRHAPRRCVRRPLRPAPTIGSPRPMRGTHHTSTSRCYGYPTGPTSSASGQQSSHMACTMRPLSLRRT
jgi:hypothetical protein